MNSTIYQIKLQIIYLYHSIARSAHMNGHLEGLRFYPVTILYVWLNNMYVTIHKQ